MVQKRSGLFGTLRGKLLAAIASLLATGATAIAALYWDSLLEQFSGGTGRTAQTPNQGTVPVRPIQVLLSRKQPAATKIQLLGCMVCDTDKRVCVTEVPPGSPAALLGVIPGDIVDEVGSQRVDSAATLSDRLGQCRRFLPTAIDVRRGDTVLRGKVTPSSDGSLKVQRALQSL